MQRSLPIGRRARPDRIAHTRAIVRIFWMKPILGASHEKVPGNHPSLPIHARRVLGMRLDQAKRLKELEKENARLKRLVADLSLDNQILKEAAQGNF